jgi:NitT/TauT family transport system substrate-binding protein
MARAGIGAVADLKGRSIAVSAPGSFPDMLARVVLAKFNLSPADVKFAAVGGDHDRYTALIGGVVDGAVISNEYLPLPASKGLKMLVSGAEAGPNFLRVCTFSTGRVLATRREDAVRYLVAQSKGLHFALAHRDETLALTREASDMTPDDPRPAFVFDDVIRTGAIAPELPIPMDKIAWMRDELLALGQIPAAGNLEGMVEPGVRAEAMKRLGH